VDGDGHRGELPREVVIENTCEVDGNEHIMHSCFTIAGSTFTFQGASHECCTSTSLSSRLICTQTATLFAKLLRHQRSRAFWNMVSKHLLHSRTTQHKVYLIYCGGHSVSTS
jgi:hypothetical protein